ncbi:MAG TPA: response regulator transcription factor [Gammaproteobacteria bacterium]|nr:response regulator transcription factor [Gammaproteobacteria bacterium]
MIKVVIIDDNKIARLGIKSLLADDEIDIIGEASDGKSGINLVQELQPDIVILDLHLPDIHGIQVCQLISEKNPLCRIIFITASQHLLTLCRLLSTPAKGLLNKDSHFSGVEAVKTVYKGMPYIQPDLGYELVTYIMKNNKHALHNLTDKEQKVLALITQGKTQEKIAEELFISPKTVSNIKFRGMKKLNVKTTQQIQEALFGSELVL